MEKEKLRMESNFQGIIFDLDGTLADTEPFHMRAWLDVLAGQGLTFDEHWFEQWIGLPDRFLADSVVAEYGLKTSAMELRDMKSLAYQQIAAVSARLYPQVEDGLKTLGAGLKLGIATNSSREDAAAVFTATRVNNYFQAVVTADDVQQLKPSPDCYLLAAERIGLDPARGLAVEDSIAGVQAAKKAGLYTLAVANSHPAEHLAEADRVFPNTERAIRWVLEQVKS
jgi:HAD superfamily hydrolase (TIGR01509 family)